TGQRQGRAAVGGALGDASETGLRQFALDNRNPEVIIAGQLKTESLAGSRNRESETGPAHLVPRQGTLPGPVLFPEGVMRERSPISGPYVQLAPASLRAFQAKTTSPHPHRSPRAGPNP